MKKFILILLISIFGLYGCKQNEKFVVKDRKIIDQQKQLCLYDLYTGSNHMEASAVLKSLYIGFLENNDKRIEKPGVNVPFEPEKNYVLMYNFPSKLIPSNPRYDNPFFEKLSQKNEDKPPVLLVKTKSLLKASNEAIVSTSCSPEPFVVSLDNLYDINQSKDSEVKSSTSGFNF